MTTTESVYERMRKVREMVDELEGLLLKGEELTARMLEVHVAVDALNGRVAKVRSEIRRLAGIGEL